MDVPNERRIVLLGKTGVGISSLANTIFGEARFQINRSNDLKNHCSQAENKSVNGRSITLIDTPGFFGRSEEEMKREIVRCITECAPGPHAFLIVLKVEKFTEQEQAVIAQMCEYFSEDALKYAAVVFTHGDQLPEGIKIKEFVDQSEGLKDLLEKCGGRCHIVDNKYWKNNQQDEYRSNQFQVEELLQTVDKMIEANKGGCYTNEMLQAVEREIQQEEQRIRKSSRNMSQKEIRKRAKSNVFKKQVNNAPKTLIKGLVCLAVIAGLFATVVVMKSKCVKVLKEAPLGNEIIAQVVEQPIAEPTSAVVSVVEEVLEVFVNKFDAMCETAYHVWNPFE